MQIGRCNRKHRIEKGVNGVLVFMHVLEAGQQKILQHLSVLW